MMLNNLETEATVRMRFYLKIFLAGFIVVSGAAFGWWTPGFGWLYGALSGAVVALFFWFIADEQDA